MNEFTPISLVPDYSISSSSGRILSNGISIESLNNTKYIAIGTSEGELFLYELGQEIPKKHTASLGSIAIVKISYVSYFTRVVIVAITLECTCYFFDIDGNENDWAPIIAQGLIFNPSCSIIFEGKSGTEILLGTNHGGIGYFTTESTSKKSKIVWKYSNMWNIGIEITSLTIINSDTIIIGRGDGTVSIFTVGENPERASSTNAISDSYGKEGIFLLAKAKKNENLVAVVNGIGKINVFNYISPGKMTCISESFIDKKPIYINFININEHPFVVVGCTDGCLYFIGNEIHNFYRYEEAAHCFIVENCGNTVLIISGLSGYLSYYTNFSFLEKKIPKFLDTAKKEIEELRKIIDDYDTPAESLVATYLYMPLPE